VEQKALDLLTTLGLVEKQNIYPHELSGGQKQRVALARSLLMKPDLLLCDEPTSGLDVQRTQQVIELLKTVASIDITIIIASHDISFLSQIAEHFIIINKGKLVGCFNKQDSEPQSYIEKFYLNESKI
jgi:polar amino acid transport system ATP-binding protein